MKFHKPLTFCLSISFLAHAFLLSSFNLYIEAEKTPSFHVWPHIIIKQDLFFSKKQASLPQGVLFDEGRVRRRLFLLPGYSAKQRVAELANMVLTETELENVEYLKIEKKPSADYVYLWGRRKKINPYQKETVSYRVLVSPKGKVVFSYPEKLPFNSQKNLYFQAYVREATVFFSDRFCWTKLEGVVQ
ncbi:MAG: hypothetical protein GF375_04480 [Candidatus Omnitrophica bacterium]|nr:hypothetical protein [Candidatus Omnitrophota bacterium]MBD3269286.1 hypothetical protein [Candidatus Omnitrophota bacterium]